MRPILFALLLAISCNVTFAQPSNVQYSEPFEEPEDGWNKVMQLKNGNTFFMNFIKGSIEVKVYDKSHKVTSTKSLESNLWEAKKMKSSKMEGLYEIDGNVVIFLQQLLDRTPTLFRIILDGNTGAIINEQKLFSLDKITMGAGFAMAFGHVDMPDFNVTKDPNSDCYAITNYKPFAREGEPRMEIVHYDGSHKEINRAPYAVDNFKYLRYVSMVVNSDRYVLICSYGFNTEYSGGKDSRVIISKLSNGSNDIYHNQLEFSNDFKNTVALMQYNNNTGMVQLLTLTKKYSKSPAFNIYTYTTKTFYTTLLTTIDPGTLSIISNKPLETSKADAYAKTTLKNPKGYFGLPQYMALNSDNSTTVIMEEMEHIEVRHSSSRGFGTGFGGTSFGGGAGVTTYNTRLDGLAITEVDKDGQEVSGYVIPKAQKATGTISPMYVSNKSNGYWSYRGSNGGGGLDNNAFLSFDYVNTPNNRYIFYNDYPENFTQTDVRKIKSVWHISDANTIGCRIADGKMEKFYLFGTPKDDDESRFCYIESSHFLKDNNTYATLMIDRNGRKKEAKIAWVTFN